MTENSGTQTTYTKSLAVTGTGALALALLTGCSTAEPEGGSAPADGDAATTTAPAESSPASSPAESTPAGSSPTGSATASGDDPVFAAIDAVHAQHPDAFIVQVDRDDDDTAHEIEAHLEGEVLEFTVAQDGTVREDDGRDRADDHERRARDSSVDATQAASAALEGRAGQSIDEMELDEEGGALVWKVELDRENGEDGDELRVDAMTGEVTQDR